MQGEGQLLFDALLLSITISSLFSGPMADFLHWGQCFNLVSSTREIVSLSVEKYQYATNVPVDWESAFYFCRKMLVLLCSVQFNTGHNTACNN